MTVREAYKEFGRKLLEAGIENGMFEARELICSVLGLSQQEFLLSDREVIPVELSKLSALIEKRASGYPLQYLLGEWEFFSLPFVVGEGVLIPRQDTETLCETVLSFLKGKTGQKVIDLCSGSGCIGITVEHYSQGNQLFLLEKSPEAIVYLKENLKRNQSKAVLIEDDVLSPQTEETDFDLILSNPPYLSKEDMDSLQKEVSFEPQMALYASEDGYFFYEEITRIWKDRLKVGGILCYEIGIHQEERVAEILKNNCFDSVCFVRDLCGIIRVVYGRRTL